MLSERLLDDISDLIKARKWDAVFDAFKDVSSIDQTSEQLLYRLTHICLGTLEAHPHHEEETILLFKLAFTAGKVSK